MTYNIIGTGNIAWLLASRLHGSGHTCTGIYGRNRAEAIRLASAFHFPLLERLSEVHDGPDACLLAVSDSALAEVAAALSFKTTTLVHMSGAAGVKFLEKSAVNTAVLWPVYSIIRTDLPAHRYFPCVWEAGTDEARRVVTRLVAAVSDIGYEASLEHRQWLHLAAVISNNFVNHLLAAGADICSREGIPFSLLQPILQQTVARAATMHPATVQTGPARRGDDATIAFQMKLLEAFPAFAPVYAAITASIKNRYGPKSGED